MVETDNVKHIFHLHRNVIIRNGSANLEFHNIQYVWGSGAVYLQPFLTQSHALLYIIEPIFYYNLYYRL